VPYRITYSNPAVEHLRGLSARQRSQVVDTVTKQLSRQPNVETRNRKPMRPNPIAPWELRIGTIRVDYSVAEEPEQVVSIHAIGIKTRNQVRIGDEEVDFS
jgi:mRNA-degrading endonuclease RelE of RelBE toxin-antitoxin system